MRTTWFCNMRRLLLTSALLCALAPALHAGVPEWFRAAARTPVPQYSPETEAVILYDEQALTVSDSGEMRAVYRSVFKILRPGGRSYGVVSVDFDKETQILSLRGWSLPAAGGEYEVKEKDALETSDWAGSVYDDTRSKQLRIPGAEVGSIVGFEYERKLRPYVLHDYWGFQSSIPLLYSRYTLQLPGGWEYKPFFLNHPELQPVSSSANRTVWEVRNMPAVEWEPAMPAITSLIGWMAVRFYPPAASAARAQAHRSWNDVGNWYNQLTADRRDASPEIRAKVTELTSGMSSNLEKIRVLARFVQREVRYVSIQIGIGGYQPHPAPQIFSNRYGDCKDKATLLSTMLKEAGIDSYYVLVHTYRSVVRPELPSLRFNHAILGIRLPADVQQSFGPEIRHAALGRILLFDPTDTITPIGHLPGTLQANYG